MPRNCHELLKEAFIKTLRSDMEKVIEERVQPTQLFLATSNNCDIYLTPKCMKD